MMAIHRDSVLLPKSKAIVCLKPGTTLTDEEVEALDEYFLLLAKERSKKLPKRTG